MKNVLGKLIDADENDLTELKTKCIRFIRRNYDDIEDTDEWGEFLDCHYELVNEIESKKAKK